MSNKKKLVLGVDPGLARTGLGLIELTDDGVQYIDHILINTKQKHTTHQRLYSIFTEAKTWLEDYQIDCFAIEELFVGINKNTIIKLSMARSMLLLLAEIKQAHVLNIPTKLVKQKIAGKGDAEKEDVNLAVCSALNITLSQYDCSDALACALYAVDVPL